MAGASAAGLQQGSSVLPRLPRRRSIAGAFLFGMILFFIIGDLLGGDAAAPLTLLAGICGWIAACLLVPQVRGSQRILVFLLLGIGLAMLFFVWTRTGQLAVADPVSRNAGLLTMIISIGFLKLVAMPTVGADSRLPIGRKAFRDTLVTLAVFGSFINISAPIIMGDRLSLNRPLNLFSCSVLTRVFSGCSSWSPFFAGMAVVLTYVAGVKLSSVMLGGLPFALMGMVTVYLLGIFVHKKQVEEFRGFPMQFASLWVPAVLALLVVTLLNLAPRLSILTVIALSGLFLTIGTLLCRRGISGALSELGHFIVDGLPRSGNELTLFLAAGVLAAGLTGIVDLGLVSLPMTRFDGVSASILLVVMVLIAMAGIHPVIQVSAFTPLLTGLQPEPLLLALTFLFAWSLGTCGSPLSGTHIIMQGRYGIPCWKGAVYNWPFVGIMLVFAVLTLLTVGHLHGL